ncbi:SEC14-like protein 4 [Uloborus diversus]|uniref:SEC14-like protein 4 n=1 Tax=Uloborus diversus TaxID=327109 RepID=UPI00240949CB|nr:SEC14-like protein 4 [Uloborus diversus]
MVPELEFSVKESEVIEELRRRFKENIGTDKYEDKMMFYRFLKARDFNVDRAEEMLKKHLEWREEKKVDTLLRYYKPNEVFHKYLSASFVGFDKEGCIVRYIPYGKIDMKGVCMSMKYVDFERYIIYLMENDLASLENQSKILGRNVSKCVYIYDFENLSFAQSTDRKCIENAMAAFKIYQDNYPERLKAAFAINASMFFSVGFAIVKSCIASSILKKVHIFGQDGWKEELLKCIDGEVLPAFLGGKKTDPDGNPLCKTFINHGGKVPEKYYIHKSIRSLADAEEAKRIVLPRASYHEETIIVEEPESFLEWEFETKARDVGFGLFLQEMDSEGEKMTELVPIQRIDTDEYAETGMYKCEKAGKYIILFDNTYSWLRSKEIYFKLSVKNPEVGQKIQF